MHLFIGVIDSLTVSNFDSLFLGNMNNLEDVLSNNHVTAEARKKLNKYVNPELIAEQTGRAPAVPAGKEEVWNSLKYVMMNPYFAPLMAEDLSGLPQALVVTCIQDVLHSDGELYALRLREAGNKVMHFHNKAGFHSINSLGKKQLDVEDARHSNTIIRNYIKENL